VAAENDGFYTDDLKEKLRLMREREKVGHTQGNRFLASIRACLANALAANHLTSNPAAGIKNFKENPPRARVLTDEEMKRFADAIAEETDPHIRAAFRLLIETGARRSEVLRAKWRDFDLDAMSWRIPSPKSGHPQVVPLTRQTVALLLHTPQVGEWLIPGADDRNHRVDLAKPWKRIVKKAKLDGVHVHDIRRTFGLDVARSAGLHVASKLLRHADVRVTERVYAPLGIDDLREAAEAVQRPAPDNVVDIEKAKKAGGA
jgi:integrase